MTKQGNLAQQIEGFFIKRLISEQQASEHTIASYRDTLKLLLRFVAKKYNKSPTSLQIEDLDVDCILDFLNDFEKNRQCSARSRNQRLAAIRSLFHYIARQMPEKNLHVQRILSIPTKRYSRKLVEYLNESEISALLSAPDKTSWFGRRDHLILALSIQTGLRLSELTQMTWRSVTTGVGAHVKVIGKGRKERHIPLSKELSKWLGIWKHSAMPRDEDHVFVSRRGTKLSSDAVQRLVLKHAKTAETSCASIGKRKVSPHLLRHSTAMRLLQSGVGQHLIALWLGHESIETTQHYLTADLKMKEQILKKVAQVPSEFKRYRPQDKLLEFLTNL